MSARLRRVKQEVYELIAPEYGTEPGRVKYDIVDGAWVSVHKAQIPARLTPNGDGLVDIALMVPAEYPRIPPYGFYCDQRLNLRGHYFQPGYHDGSRGYSRDLINKGWNWYCAHARERRNELKDWRPSSDIRSGDNLLRYIHFCLSVLSSQGTAPNSSAWRRRMY